MKEFFVELFSEELPFKVQENAKEQMISLFTNKISGLINFENIECFITPMRIVLKANLSEKTNALISEKRGPQTSSNQNAINGFLKANNIDSIEKCEIKNINGKDYYIIKSSTQERNTYDVIPEIIEYIIKNFKWPKSMQWYSDIRWIRPLRNIFTMFDGKFIETPMFKIDSDQIICTHKLLGENFSPNNFEDYVSQLKNNYVILSEKKRFDTITNGIQKIESEKNIKVFLDKILISEIVGITEFPVPFTSSFNKEFLTLPEEILIKFLIHSLKVFPTFETDGSISNVFVGIANIKDTKNPIIGSTKLLNAKLSDAKFFFEKDIKNPLISYFPKLKEVNFYNNLGSIEDRVQRISKIAIAISGKFKNIDKQKIEKISLLAKCDLSTSMVFEYPELQGIVGSYIAKFHNEDNDLTQAIKEQYLPESLDDQSPSNDYSVIYSIADKVEYLLSFFSVGIIPTGSSDPLGLKRAALFIIKIFLDNKLDFTIQDIISIAAKELSLEDTSKLCCDFIIDKFQNFTPARKNTLSAITNSEFKIFPHEIINLSFEIESEKNTTSIENLANIHKRFSNFSLNNKILTTNDINLNLIQSDYEKALVDMIIYLEKNAGSIFSDNFQLLLKTSNDFYKISEDFFANTLINDKNHEIKNNREIISTVAINILNNYLNFSYLY